MATIIKYAQVEQISDNEADGGRIKARIRQDGNNDVPWAFPLLPKQFQTGPKVGEGVFIITQDSDNNKSNRFYLGPIVSQQNFNTKCSYNNGKGAAISLLQGNVIGPVKRLSLDARTKGAFPNINSVAMVGRESQDIIMQHGSSDNTDELNIRCGIRKEDDLTDKSYSTSKTIFNNIDPAYIQLKYGENLGSKVKNYRSVSGSKIEEKSQTNSVVNVIADKINLVGRSEASETIISEGVTDNEHLIQDSRIDELMSSLHQAPYGDVLVEILTIMKDAILTHVHNYNLLPPVMEKSTLSLDKTNLDKILSKNVRIN